MQMHFGPSLFENPREELSKLKQTASVKLYFDAFNELAARVYGMDDALMLDCFVGGLHPDLKREVKSRSPASLMQAVSLAKLFEDKFFPPTQNGRSSLRPQLTSHPRTPNHTQQRTVPALPSPPNIPHTPPLLPTPPVSNTLRKLSSTEIQFRRDRGLYFTCDERYTPAHKCSSKHYFLIQTLEEVPEESQAATHASEPV
ncbi:hypothetical protein S245_029686 [Arachis hypogaea]